MNVKQASPGLAVLQRNVELENENRQLQKELLEQKLRLIEYKASTEAKLEEARIREEKLIQSNEDFKREMKKQFKETNRIMKQQSEETNRMMKQMMEMFQKQAQSQLHNLSLFSSFCCLYASELVLLLLKLFIASELITLLLIIFLLHLIYCF